MVFGQLVDSVLILGSQRKSYVLIGGGCTAAGLVTLAGAAGQWLTVAGPDALFVLGALLIVLGTVIQDVVADAMSTEVVSRTGADGAPRPDKAVRAELGMVQVLGRLALSAGILRRRRPVRLAGDDLSRETVFLIGLVIPAISVSGIFLYRGEAAERRPLDWRILGGGIAFGAVVVALALGRAPFAQEIIFLVSMVVICAMLVLVTREVDGKARMAIFYSAIIIFAFRATPAVGDGFFWWTLDVLKFDAAFYGHLRQTAAVLALVGMWAFSKQLTDYSVPKTLFWLTVAGTVLSLPNLGSITGWRTGRRRISASRAASPSSTAASSPFAQLSMIPLLSLIAFHAPEGRRATWFALMASLMNMALVAGQLQTKYLNEMFTVGRGDYAALGPLLIVVLVAGFVIPVAAIALFGRRV